MAMKCTRLALCGKSIYWGVVLFVSGYWYVCVCACLTFTMYCWYGWCIPVLSRIRGNGAGQTTVQLNWSCWIKGSSGKSIQQGEPGGFVCACMLCICGEPWMDLGSVTAWLSLFTDSELWLAFTHSVPMYSIKSTRTFKMCMCVPAPIYACRLNIWVHWCLPLAVITKTTGASPQTHTNTHTQVETDRHISTGNCTPPCIILSSLRAQRHG